ncbi:hypothetical protein P4S72_21730 [Vibrio sp. PP-XX7]
MSAVPARGFGERGFGERMEEYRQQMPTEPSVLKPTELGDAVLLGYYTRQKLAPFIHIC